MDGTGRLRGDVAGMPPGNENCRNSFLHSFFILRDLWIELAVRALEVGVGDHCRAAMTGAADVDDVCVAFPDDPIKMHVDELSPGVVPQ